MYLFVVIFYCELRVFHVSGSDVSVEARGRTCLGHKIGFGLWASDSGCRVLELGE